MKSVRVFLDPKNEKRIITVTGVAKNIKSGHNRIHIGMAIKLPEDANDPELAADISMGKALKNPTAVIIFQNTRVNKYILNECVEAISLSIQHNLHNFVPIKNRVGVAEEVTADYVNQ